MFRFCVRTGRLPTAGITVMPLKDSAPIMIAGRSSRGIGDVLVWWVALLTRNTSLTYGVASLLEIRLGWRGTSTRRVPLFSVFTAGPELEHSIGIRVGKFFSPGVLGVDGETWALRTLDGSDFLSFDAKEISSRCNMNEGECLPPLVYQYQTSWWHQYLHGQGFGDSRDLKSCTVRRTEGRLRVWDR